MKSHFEPLIKDSSMTPHKEKLNTKTLLIFHISIIILISLCFLVFYIRLMIKDESIKYYQSKVFIYELKEKLQEQDVQSKLMQTKSETAVTEKQLRSSHKSSLEYNLKAIKGVSKKLSNQKESWKRSIELAKSSKLLSVRDFEKTETWTKCIFVSDCFKVSRDGFYAKVFHEKCDGLKPTVSYIQAENGIIVGGFTTESWDGNGLKYDNKAIMFSLKRNIVLYNVESKPAIKVSPNLLPSFGRNDVYISEKESSNRRTIECFTVSSLNLAREAESYNDILIVKDIEVYHMNCEGDHSKS